MTNSIKSIAPAREMNCAFRGAYGGYQVQLTGKRRKDGKGYRGMGSGCVDVTSGYQSARNALADLWKNDSKGYVREKVRRYEKYSRR